MRERIIRAFNRIKHGRHGSIQAKARSNAERPRRFEARIPRTAIAISAICSGINMTTLPPGIPFSQDACTKVAIRAASAKSLTNQQRVGQFAELTFIDKPSHYLSTCLMRQPTQFGKALIALLVGMLAVFMTVEVAHSHSLGTGVPNGATHCQLCSVAHIATVSQPALLTEYVLHLIGFISIGEPRPASRSFVPVSSIRPPPAVDSANS